MNQAYHVGGSAHLLLFKYHLIEEGREGVHQKLNFDHRWLVVGGGDLGRI